MISKSTQQNNKVLFFKSFTKKYAFDINSSSFYEIGKDQLIPTGQCLDKSEINLESSPVLIPPPFIDSKSTFSAPLIRSISLAVSQSCNLACQYCYADGGSFGGNSKLMKKEVALASIQKLITEAKSGEKVVIAFMGGEPLLNWKLIKRATNYAVALGQQKNITTRFSITTNGTLLDKEKIDFFQHYKFTVTISLDGKQSVNDILRPTKVKLGSFEQSTRFLNLSGEQVSQFNPSIRVTVTPINLDLKESFQEFISLGFKDVGFSPMLSASKSTFELQQHHFDLYLERLKEIASSEIKRAIKTGKKIRLFNFLTALQRIHKGENKSHPCGAGASYTAVSAEGEYYLCHRYVENKSGHLGDLISGIDDDKRGVFLTEKHVNNQLPCSSCWAKHLCGGGCYHEVENRGRVNCDFIRDWLFFCLKTYADLHSKNQLKRILGV